MDTSTTNTVEQHSTNVDEGLRNFILSVLNYVVLGTFLTGIAAYATASIPFLAAFAASFIGFVTIFATSLACMLACMYYTKKAGVKNRKIGVGLYIAFTILMGMSLSVIASMYTVGSIYQVFFVSAIAFMGLCIYGHTTKRDLSGLRPYLIVSLLALLSTMVLSIFFIKSTILAMCIHYAAVLIFSLFIVYDFQMLTKVYYTISSEEDYNHQVISGAIELYLDFINLFIHLLAILGDRE